MSIKEEPLPPVEPLLFDLMYRRQVEHFIDGKWVFDKEETEAGPTEPLGFAPLRGFNGAVSKEAERLNNVQDKGRERTYFFFPEVAPLEGAR